MEIYKQGQGYWARVLCAVGAALIGYFSFDLAWEGIASPRARYIVSPLILVGFAGAGLYFSFFFHKTADFLIEVEAEMRKVSWPSWDEVSGSTIVVLVTVFVMGVLLFCSDYVVSMGYDLLFSMR